jgi:hypothetical protein
MRGARFVGKHMSDLVAGVTTKHDPIWPTAVIVFGIGLTAAWVGLLGYGLVKLIELAI